MSIALYALATCIQKMLMNLVKEEAHMLLGVPHEIKRMETRLTDLKRFLADADRRNITDESVGEWVKESRCTMYEITDFLESCQLKAMEQGPSRDMGCFNPLLFCTRNPLYAHSIGSQLRTLNKKIEDIGRRSKTFQFIELSSYEEHGRKKEPLRLARWETTGEIDKMGLVGEKVEEETKTLVELLTREEKTISKHNKIMVFAIAGVGGIGKTTLAQNIFYNEIIQQEFEKKIWLSVNQNFNEIDLLKGLITQAQGNHNIDGNIKATLVQVLKETLKGKKILLVMDDVWDHEAWEMLKCPLTNVLARGSRVLITTRHDMVARGLMAEEPYHRVNKLGQEDAWSLLKKQVVKDNNDESLIDMSLKDIGMQILAICDGLPLAVKAMGGLLRQKKIRRRDWENVLNGSVWSESQMPEDLNNAIYLSYQDLPYYLKPCFLHFSLLPKSVKFFLNDIVGMWISEGFVDGGSRDLEELGREYYDELISRNLIEPLKNWVDQRCCSMHDVVRSFAQYVARDEALAAHSSMANIIGRLDEQKFIRWISIETKGSETEQLEWTYLHTRIPIRILISVGRIKIKPSDSLVTFSSLRVLYVRGTNFNALVESLVELKHLRYLSIENTNTYMLPENIGKKVKLLQYISLGDCKSLVKLPNSIIELRHLRLLNLNGSNINNVPKGFSSLTNLRKLFGFPAHMDGDWCSLEELGALSNLTELKINCLENLSSSVFARKARLCEKVHLSRLWLRCTSKKRNDDGRLVEEQQQIVEVFDELCPPPCLEYLDVTGYFGWRLPKWMTVASLGSLRNLMLENLSYCTELADSFYHLPCLELLQIEKAPLIKSIGPEFLQQHNHEHLSTMGSFASAPMLEVTLCPDLTRIGCLSKMQEVIICECPKLKILEGMPALQKLKLKDYKTKTLPRYLQDARPLHLEVLCDVVLLNSMAAGKSGPEWDKFCHIRQVKAYADDDDKNIKNKWYVAYTRDPFSFKTNVSRRDIKRALSVHLPLNYRRTCPIEEERVVEQVCANKCRPLCQRFRCNAYRHLVRWLWVACLHCCEAKGFAVRSDQWTEVAVYPACKEIIRRPRGGQRG